MNLPYVVHLLLEGECIFNPGPCFLLCNCVCRDCLCVRVQGNSKNIEPINFIFGGGLLSDPGKLGNHSISKKDRPGVKVGVEGPKFGPNDKT